MDEIERKRGFLFYILLFFDWFHYGIEWLRGVLLNPLLDFVGWCLSFLLPPVFLKVQQRDEEMQQPQKEPIRYCLHDQRLSFHDTLSIVNGVPCFLLASDDAESVPKATKETSGAGASKYETIYSEIARSSTKHESAFAQRSSEGVQACAFSKDGSHFAICYVSRKVALWNIDHGTLLQEELLTGNSMSSISFLGEENFVLLICPRDSTCWRWDIDVNGSHLMKIFDKDNVSSIGEQIFSQKSVFYEDGTKLVLSTIANSEDGPMLDVVLVNVTSSPFKLEASPLTSVNVERDFVISNAILSPDGNGLLVSLMDQAFEDSYCLLWPDLIEHRGYCKRLTKGTIGSWSSDSKYIVTWVMTHQMNSDDKDENSAFILNVEDMREGLKNAEHAFEDEKIANPFGGNVFWCQVTQDMDNKDRLIMGVVGKTTRFLFFDMASKIHTHTIETRISAENMILWKGEAWIQSYVAQRTVKGLSPMSVAKDGSMFGAVLGWPSEVIIWDVCLGIEILKVSPTNVQANRFKGGIDLMMSPSCTKFAIVGSNEVMVFCPSAPSKNEKRDKNCLESQMVQMDNPHTSQDNLSRFKMSFSGDGNSLGVLCIGLPKMQVWNLPQGTSCTIHCAQIEEGGNIQDFCLSNNGQYLAINIGKYIQIMDCKAKEVAQMVGSFNVDSKVVSMGINEDASELVICMEDGSIWCYEILCEDLHLYCESSPSTSNIDERASQNSSSLERIKPWLKRHSMDVKEPLIGNNERDGQSITGHTSICIRHDTPSFTCTRHVLVEESNEATFQISPDFEEVIRISEPQGVEVWDLKTKEQRRNRVSDVASFKRSSYEYSHNSSITQQAHDELTSKKNELLVGTSIDLTKRTTLLQSSRDNIIVGGNSSSKALSQRRDKATFDYEYNEGKQEGSHSIYVINLEDVKHRRRLSGRNLEPRKGLAISHDGRHVACLAGDYGSKVVVWNVYASERLLPDYNFLSLTLTHDMLLKEGINRDIVPLIQDFGINFFNFRHPSGMSIFEEAIYELNNDLLRVILRYVSKKKIKISFLMRDTRKDLIPSKPQNLIDASIHGRSPKTLCVLLKYLRHRVTHEVEVARILNASLFCILSHYQNIFIRAIRDPRLWSDWQRIRVPEGTFEGAHVRTTTSDFLNISRGKTQEFWNKKVNKDGKERRVPLITCISSTFPFVDACKIGLHGILHNTLFNKVHSLAFGSFVAICIVNHKWSVYGKQLMLQEFAHHLALTGAYMAYCFTLCNDGTYKISSRDGSEENSSATQISLLICWMLAVPCLYQELRQCALYVSKDGYRGFLCWLGSTWNWMEVLSYLTIVIVIPLAEFFLLTEGRKSIFISSIVALEALLLWCRVLYYARTVPRIGKFVTVISLVISAVVPFLLIAFCVMFGFAIAFHVLYRHVIATMNEEEENSDNSDLESLRRSFGTFGRTLFTVFGFTFGDFDLEQIYHAPSGFAAIIVFVLYMVTVSTTLLNMLIAVMTNQFNGTRDREEIRAVHARAMVLDDIENMMSYRRKMEINQKLGKYLHIITQLKGCEKRFRGYEEYFAPSTNSMTETFTKIVREEIDSSLDRRGLLVLRRPELPATSNVFGPLRLPLENIPESAGSSPSRIRSLAPSRGITEPEQHWNDYYNSDEEYTDEEYTDRYSDDSD